MAALTARRERANGHTRFVVDEQRALAVEFQIVGDEPPELGMKRNELHVALGLAVAGCPWMSPAANESTGLVAGGQANRLGGHGHESKQENEPCRSGEAIGRQLHGQQS